MSYEHHLRPLEMYEEGEVAGEVQADGESQSGQDAEEIGPEAVDDSAQLPQEGQAAEEVAIENPAVRAVPDPGQPTREERAMHELTHLPFRPWCADCVAGRAANDPHRRLAREVDDGPPKVSVDYGFESSTDGTEQRTILVVKVAGSNVVIARCVKGKGRADPYAVKWLIE